MYRFYSSLVVVREIFAVGDSIVGSNMDATPRHSLLGTLNLARRRVGGPFVNVMDSGGSVIPKRVGVSGVISTIGRNITLTNNIPVMFPTVTIYSNVTVKRRKVGCSLMAHRLVTSSARTVTGTRTFSTLMVIPGYSGGIPNVLVTTTEVGIPAIFMDNNPVLTNRIGNGGADLSDVFRTINTCATGGVATRRLTRFRGGTYPSYNSYSNVCATGDVGYLARTVNVKLRNGNAVPTICSSEVGLTGRTNVGIVRLLRGSVHPHSVLARGTFVGTLAISVTLNYSAGAVLRLPTVTGRTNIGLGLSVTGRVDGGAPGLYRLTPTNRACVRSLGRTNNICTMVGRLAGIKLLSASLVATANGAMNRGVGNYRVGSASVVHPIAGPCDGANNVTILGNGLTPSNSIIGEDTITRRVVRRGNTTEIFSYRRSTLDTVCSNGVGPNRIIIVECRNPGNNPNVERVLGPASTVVNDNLNGYITLVASNHFSNTAENTTVNRMSPRTTINNPVTLIRRNSVVRVSVPTGAVGLLISSRRLTGHGTR